MHELNQQGKTCYSLAHIVWRVKLAESEYVGRRLITLIWIDLEMTGLEPQSDQIIEIATVVTNAQLDILAQGPVIAIHQPDSKSCQAMDEWNTRHHGDSGLTARVLASTRSSMADAEA